MIAMELVETAWASTTHALQTVASVLAAEPAPTGINTDGVVSFFASKIAPDPARRTRSDLHRSGQPG